MKLVLRETWGARRPKSRVRGVLSAEPTCHWNGPTIKVAGKTTWDHSKCAGLVRGIQNYHMDTKGWSDIAYNYVECPHGYTFEGRGLNIINGANGTNFGNRSSHAVCCLAGEGNPFSENEKVGFKNCIRYISIHALTPNSCKGHRDHKSTACPGDARYSWVHKGMPVNSIVLPTPIVKVDNMLKIIWFKGISNDSKWPNDTQAAYEVLYATSGLDKDKEIAVEATWIPNPSVLNARRYSLGGIENQTRQNPKILADAGCRFYDGPYRTR